jgi:hypothetical protein
VDKSTRSTAGLEEGSKGMPALRYTGGDRERVLAHESPECFRLELLERQLRGRPWDQALQAWLHWRLLHRLRAWVLEDGQSIVLPLLRHAL